MTGLKEKVSNLLHPGHKNTTSTTQNYDPSPLSSGTSGLSDAAQHGHNYPGYDTYKAEHDGNIAPGATGSAGTTAMNTTTTGTGATAGVLPMDADTNTNTMNAGYTNSAYGTGVGAMPTTGATTDLDYGNTTNYGNTTTGATGATGATGLMGKIENMLPGHKDKAVNNEIDNTAYNGANTATVPAVGDAAVLPMGTANVGNSYDNVDTDYRRADATTGLSGKLDNMMAGNQEQEFSKYDSSSAYTAAGQEPYGSDYSNTATAGSTKPTIKERIADMLPGNNNKEVTFDTNTTRNTGAAYGSTGAAETMGADGQVCVPGYQEAPVNTGEKVFRVGEDHEVEKERIERWVEHRPVEREYVTKVQPTGKVIEGSVTADMGVATVRDVKEFTCYNTGTTVVQGVQGNPIDRPVM